MFITKTSLPRRTFLRGARRAVVALPLLDAMVPAATALAQTAAHTSSRFGFIYVPHGADMASWTPAAAGTGLRALAHADDARGVQESDGRRQQPEARGRSGRDARRRRERLAERRGPEAHRGGGPGVWHSIDQVLAQQIGQSSPFPSLEFGTEDFTGYVGGCTPGYSCAYHDAIAWASPTRPLPMEINPRGAFERLFGDGGSTRSVAAICARTAASSTAS